MGIGMGTLLAGGGIAAVSAVGIAVTLADDEEAGPSTRPGVVVSRVIDGDTLVVRGGDRVRLIGIDTPEQGECGYREATQRLRSLVEGERVVLDNPGRVQDEDRYGRLLRYVDRGMLDAGYVLVQAGHAQARYDSRDGYDRHPRQRTYRSADREFESRCETQERLRRERWATARAVADRTGISARPDETARELIRRARTTSAVQRRQQAAEEARRQAAAERRRAARGAEATSPRPVPAQPQPDPARRTEP